MKLSYSHIGLAKICDWFGITRQAYYQNIRQRLVDSVKEDLVIQEVLKIRKVHKRIGGRKLYLKLQPFLLDHQFKMGRDRFFSLLFSHDLLIKRRRRKPYTTNSSHWLRKYPNLIQGIKLTEPNQLWVSDITYWKVGGEFLYISLITDAFSRMIVGYQLANSLEAVESIEALKMALRKLGKTVINLIHHSDRGVQYCSYGYTNILHGKGIKISMTESGDPLDNAIAERMNGILKYEYLFEEKVDSINQAKEVLEKSVNLYNTDRPHMSIGNMTPENVHNLQMNRELKREWKNYYKKHLEQCMI